MDDEFYVAYCTYREQGGTGPWAWCLLPSTMKAENGVSLYAREITLFHVL